MYRGEDASKRFVCGAWVLAALLALTAGLLTWVPTPASAGDPFGPGRIEGAHKRDRVDAQFFAMGMDVGITGDETWPSFEVGAARLAIGWKWIEQRPGVYDWAAMDVRMAAVEERGAKPLLTLIGTPLFHATGPGPATSASPPSLPAYRKFVRALVARYGERADYQVWNEPSVEMFFTGTPRHVAEMTRILGVAVRRIAPDALAVAPSTPLRGDHPAFRKWFRTYLSQKPGSRNQRVSKFFDVASISAYPMPDEDPEDGLALTRYAKRVLKKYGFRGPLWATEINYGTNGVTPIPPRISEVKQGSFVIRTLVLHASLGADRVYWWHWTPKTNVNTNLQDRRGDLTRAGLAYASAQSWLLTAKPTGCRTAHGVSRCGFRVAGGVDRFVYWSRSGKKQTMRTPKGSVARTNALGSTRSVGPNRKIRVGMSPVMVEVRRSR